MGTTRINELKRPQRYIKPSPEKPKRVKKAKPENRNKDVKYTIQQLRSENKATGGKFFNNDQLTSKERIHGHPKLQSNGSYRFITSRVNHSRERIFSIWGFAEATPRNIELVETKLTHAGALQQC